MSIRLEKLIGDEVHLSSDGIIYLGDPDTDGTWRVIINGDDLEFQKREAGTYVMKGAFQP